MAKVIVEKPVEGREVKSGVIAVNPNNSDFGSIMFSKTGFSLNNEGSFLNADRRVYFMGGKVTDLEAFVAEKNLTPGCDYSKKVGVEMTLAIKEQTIPFFEGQSQKINPSNGEELFTQDGEPIYRKVSLVVAGSDDALDILVSNLPSAVVAENVSAANILSKAE